MTGYNIRFLNYNIKNISIKNISRYVITKILKQNNIKWRKLNKSHIKTYRQKKINQVT